MIISGSVGTTRGPVDIRDLHVGDKVVNELQRPHEVISKEVITVKEYYTFLKNTKLAITSDDMSVRTFFGDVVPKDSIMIQAFSSNMRNTLDTIKLVLVPEGISAYKVRLDS